jgi:hypothetical protein
MNASGIEEYLSEQPTGASDGAVLLAVPADGLVGRPKTDWTAF